MGMPYQVMRCKPSWNLSKTQSIFIVFLFLMTIRTHAGWENGFYPGIGIGYPHRFYLSPTYILCHHDEFTYSYDKGFMSSVDLGLRASSVQAGMIWIQGRDNPDSYARISLAASALVRYDSEFNNHEAYYGIRTNLHVWFVGIDLGAYRSAEEDDYLYSVALRIYE